MSGTGEMTEFESRVIAGLLAQHEVMKAQTEHLRMIRYYIGFAYVLWLFVAGVGIVIAMSS